MRSIFFLASTFFLPVLLCLSFAQATPLTRVTFKKFREVSGRDFNLRNGFKRFVDARKTDLSKNPEVIKLLNSQGRKIDDVNFDPVVDMLVEDFGTIMYLVYKNLLSEEEALEAIRMHASPLAQKLSKILLSPELQKSVTQFNLASTKVADREMLKILGKANSKK